MWDFEHPPLAAELAQRYELHYTQPSLCAAELLAGRADLGLIPIAALTPELAIVPGCTIASLDQVRSIQLIVKLKGGEKTRALEAVRTVSADTASRSSLAYAEILFRKFIGTQPAFLPAAADPIAMLQQADAAILIGDPALLSLEERENRRVRTGESLVYHDLAEEWTTLTGLPFVSAVWGIACSSSSDGRIADVQGIAHGSPLDESVAEDFLKSRDHGLANIETLVAEWSARLPIPESTIRTYITTNIHYILDDECIAGMKAFFREAAALGILPEYTMATPG